MKVWDWQRQRAQHSERGARDRARMIRTAMVVSEYKMHRGGGTSHPVFVNVCVVGPANFARHGTDDGRLSCHEISARRGSLIRAVAWLGAATGPPQPAEGRVGSKVHSHVQAQQKATSKTRRSTATLPRWAANIITSNREW